MRRFVLTEIKPCWLCSGAGCFQTAHPGIQATCSRCKGKRTEEQRVDLAEALAALQEQAQAEAAGREGTP